MSKLCEDVKRIFAVIKGDAKNVLNLIIEVYFRGLMMLRQQKSEVIWEINLHSGIHAFSIS